MGTPAGGSIHSSKRRSVAEEVNTSFNLRAFRQSAIVFGLLGVLVLLGPQPNRAAQSSAIENRILQPPRAGLLAVHFPSVETLQPEVREHLSSLERTLTATVKNSPATD